MSRRDALFLRLVAIWTVVIWSVFVKNQIGDDTTSTGFKVVHLTLAVVSMVLAVGVWRVASRSSRLDRERERAGTPS